LIELSVYNASKVMIRRDGQVFAVEKMISDGSGELFLSNGTILTAEHHYHSSTNSPQLHNRTLVMTNIDVIVLDALVNTTNVVVEANANLYLTPFGTSYAMTSPDFLPVLANQTTYWFADLTIYGTVVIDYLRYQSPIALFFTPPIVLNITNTLLIGSLGALQSNGQGFPSSLEVDHCTTNLHGLGCSPLGKGLGGAGGSYGGKGGSGFGVSSTATVYDSFPMFGSGGGGSFPGVQGGHGGGIIYLVGHTVILNGTISANGDKVSSKIVLFLRCDLI